LRDWQNEISVKQCYHSREFNPVFYFMNLQSLFPITLPSCWQNEAVYPLPAHLRSWLIDPNSLTARLKKHCQHFRVELLGQQIQPCQGDEIFAGINEGDKVLVREVLLYCDEQPQVFARSILPLSSLTGEEQALANLGTQSLGQVIFNNPSLERHAIEIAHYDQASAMAILSNRLGLIATEHLWGRRSIFVLERKPFMVAEVFLPNAYAYQPSEKTGSQHD